MRLLFATAARASRFPLPRHAALRFLSSREGDPFQHGGEEKSHLTLEQRANEPALRRSAVVVNRSGGRARRQADLDNHAEQMNPDGDEHAGQSDWDQADWEETQGDLGKAGSWGAKHSTRVEGWATVHGSVLYVLNGGAGDDDAGDFARYWSPRTRRRSDAPPGSPRGQRSAAVVVVGNFETGDRSVLVVESEAERRALEACILGLTEDDGSESRRVAAELRAYCAPLWCADFGRACRNRRPIKVDASLSVLFSVGAQRCLSPADFVLDVLSVPLLAVAVDAAVLKQLCAASLLSEGLAAVAGSVAGGAAPQFAREGDLDGAAWLLGNLAALAPKLTLKGALARNFAVVCAKLLEQSTCASALLGDAETVVVKWTLKDGAQTPIVAPPQLRLHVSALLDNRAALQQLANALVGPGYDDDALDMPTSADLALGASLASLKS
ncbi:hypothetical protein M885DRAFT_624829 [Pelagophyceae sp. CCMP2097]|nr:hypothetical protein M885DRAFT_624829 [Pelagophyceae sp. CCMP2097]